MKKIQAILFCVPEWAYKGMNEEEASRRYRDFAIKEYDSLIKFQEWYDPETPNEIEPAGEKRGRTLIRTLFSNQPVIKVGNSKVALSSSSYLFNLTSSARGIYLPDLDVIESVGEESDVKKFNEEVTRLYARNGWKVQIVSDNFEDEANARTFGSGFLRGEARRLAGYDFEKLYWGN
jgi:hypothetical protein